MLKYLMTILAVFTVIVPTTVADYQLTSQSTAVFASVERATEILTTPDDYIRQLGPVETAIRMDRPTPVTKKQFLDHIADNILPWTKANKEIVTEALEAIAPRLHKLNVPLPSTVHLIKTTGKEDAGLAYTRHNAIVFHEISANSRALQHVIAHELFHIISRCNPKLRNRLYKIIGFQQCPTVQLPEDLYPARITNPDAPLSEHCIRLTYQGDTVYATPVLYADPNHYDRARASNLFSYLQFALLTIDPNETGDSDAELSKSRPTQRLLQSNLTEGFFEQIGSNTPYIIHPEEILADNFALLVLNQKDVPSPEILTEMQSVFAQYQPKTICPQTQ